MVPYSSTNSQQDNGYLAYASIDLGFNIIRQKGLRVGAFAGYHYLEPVDECIRLHADRRQCRDLRKRDT